MEANKNLLFVIMAVTLLFVLHPRFRGEKKLCVQILTIILTLFAGLRTWRSGDMYHYCYVFLECNMPGWSLNINNYTDTIGLQILFHLCGQLGLGFEAVVFLVAAFVAVTLGVLVYRYSPSVYWSYMIYLAMAFYMSSFDILKQAIAMALVMWAMMAVLEDKPRRFLVLVAVAFAFHQPSLIFIIAYPFANKKINTSYFFVVAAMLLVIYFFGDQIIDLATEMYYGEEIEFETDGNVGGKVRVMVMIMALAVILRPLHNFDRIYRQVFNMMVLAAMIQYFSMYDNVFTRLADYYYQFSVLFIPLMLQPGGQQARSYPRHADRIRYWDSNTYLFLNLGITLFAIWFYFSNVEAAVYLTDFHFVWQDSGRSSLELLEEMLLTYGG